MRRDVQPWQREWVEQSARAVRQPDPWVIPALARFTLGFVLGFAAFSTFACMIMKVL